MPMIRRQISIAAPPRTVWNALVSAEALARWLGEVPRLDAREGGRVDLTPRGVAPVSGLFHTFRPTAKAEISFDKKGESPWKGTFLSFLVSRDGRETSLNVQHDGALFDEPAARAEVDEFWRQALQRLRDGVEAA